MPPPLFYQAAELVMRGTALLDLDRHSIPQPSLSPHLCVFPLPLSDKRFSQAASYTSRPHVRMQLRSQRVTRRMSTLLIPGVHGMQCHPLRRIQPCLLTPFVHISKRAGERHDNGDKIARRLTETSTIALTYKPDYRTSMYTRTTRRPNQPRSQ